MLRIISKNWFRLTLIFVVSFISSLIVASLLRMIIFPKKTEVSGESPPSSNVVETEKSAPLDPDENLPTFINLQPVIDSWLKDLPASTRVGLIIHDLNHNLNAAEHNSETKFSNASLYKLIFAYDGYLEIDRGAASLDDIVEIDESREQYSLETCLNRMISISDNYCGEDFYNDPARQQRVDNLLRDLQLTHTTEHGLYTTPADMLLFLQALWNHSELSIDNWARLQDSMLNQPLTEAGDNPRRGLPSGFDLARVYAKSGYAYNNSGSNWLVYNDAAIIDFVQEKHQYAVIIMTENLPSPELLQELGEKIEAYVVSNGVEQN